jgi:murein L,D-transpeptidase YafK
MTFEEYDKIIEEIINSSGDDKVMLEGFDKLRNAFKELDEKVKSAVEEVEALTKKYEDLRQTKVNEFFSREDKADEEVAEEVVEDVVEDKVEDEITVDDLFEDDIEVEVTEDDIIKEDEEKEEDE